MNGRWIDAGYDPSVGLPKTPKKLAVLGLGELRGWIPKATISNDADNGWLISGDDVEHVLAWRVKPSFPRKLKLATIGLDAYRVKASRFLLAKGLHLDDLLGVWRGDLDGRGRKETFICAKGGGRDGSSYGLILFEDGKGRTSKLFFDHGAWPTVLAGADFVGDHTVQVIVGGPAMDGKVVEMWSFKDGRPKRLASFAFST